MPEGVALARDLVGPAMESAIARLTPDVRAVAAYHLGFADAAGNPIRSGSGMAAATAGSGATLHSLRHIVPLSSRVAMLLRAREVDILAIA